MRKIVRELHKQFPGVEIEVTGYKHYRLRFPGGLIITTSGTPSDWRARLNLRALDRRKLNQRAGRKSIIGHLAVAADADVYRCSKMDVGQIARERN